jgi:peptidyl-prolyl cis-trans isomerase B (cyclophilin B)
MKKILIAAIALAMCGLSFAGDATEDSAIKQIDEMIAKAAVDKSAAGWKNKLPMPTVATFDADSSYFADMKTNYGKIRIKLMPDVAPMHVTSLIYLTRLGFYDDLKFHRVIPGFMAQGGCPLGTGTGSPGYKYAGEFRDDVKHDKPGVLSQANSGPGTDGSQFFLTFVATPHLNGKHTIYGEIVEGLDTTMKAIEPLGSRQGATKELVMLESMTISVE